MSYRHCHVPYLSSMGQWPPNSPQKFFFYTIWHILKKQWADDLYILNNLQANWKKCTDGLRFHTLMTTDCSWTGLFRAPFSCMFFFDKRFFLTAESVFWPPGPWFGVLTFVAYFCIHIFDFRPFVASLTAVSGDNIWIHFNMVSAALWGAEGIYPVIVCLFYQ